MKDQLGDSVSWVLLALSLLVAPLPAASQEAGDIVEGIVEVVQADDFVNGRADFFYLLQETARKRTHELRFEGGRAPLVTGDRVRVLVSGRDRSGALLAAPAQVEVIARARSAAGVVSGEKGSVVLLVNFQGLTVSCSKSQVADIFYTGASSTDKNFQEMSFQSLSFPADTDGDGEPDVLGPYTIDSSPTDSCDFWTWAEKADAAATAAGVDLSLYKYKMYVLPNGTACPYGGLGTLGCGDVACRSWNFFCGSAYIYTHEIGHNLTMHHASSDPDNNGLVNAEYGDASDVMGCCGQIQVNAPHKVEMGWIPPEKVVDLEQGSHFLPVAPSEVDPDDTLDPQVLRALGFYTFSTRKAIGFDTSIPLGFVDRLSVHRHSDWNPDCIYTGLGKPRGYHCQFIKTLLVTTLGDGQTFEDAGQGLRITQVSHGSAGVTVDAQYEPPGRDFYTLSPCRLFNTRESWPLTSGVEEIFVLKDLCGIPPTARALAVNMTVTGPTAQGNIALYPGQTAPPGTSSINFRPGEIRANSAVLPLSPEGYGTIHALPFVQGEGTVHLILDVFGYFE